MLIFVCMLYICAACCGKLVAVGVVVQKGLEGGGQAGGPGLVELLLFRRILTKCNLLVFFFI